MSHSKMTEEEANKLFDDTIDRVQYDIVTEEELSKMSARDLVKATSGLDQNSAKYRLYDYELKIRSIREQHNLNEQILEKQHKLNEKISSKQNITTLQSALITCAAVIVGSIITVVLTNLSTTQANNQQLSHIGQESKTKTDSPLNLQKKDALSVKKKDSY